MADHSAADFLVAKRMHGLKLEHQEAVPTWFLADAGLDLWTADMAQAQKMDAQSALDAVMRRGPHHWLAHVNGQAFPYTTDGRIAASIPLEQLP